MSPTREVALGLGLIACTLGTVLSQMVLVSARRSGIYRRRRAGGILMASRDTAAFFLVLRSWVSRVHLFMIGAFAIAVGWSVVEIAGW